MIVTLNAGFGYPLGKKNLRMIRSLGFNGIRQGIALGLPESNAAAIVREISEIGMVGMMVVGGWARWNHETEQIYMERTAPDIEQTVKDAAMTSELMDSFGCKGYIEIGNEPDQTNKMSAKYFVELFKRCLATIRWRSKTREVITGGVANLESGIGYLQKCVDKGLPTGLEAPDVLVGIHPYRSHAEPWRKVDGQTIARIAEKIRASFGPYAITECGWHSAPQVKGCILCPTEYTFSYDDIRRFARWELDHWSSYGADVYNWYQHKDGFNPEEPEDNYGVLTKDGIPKPVVRTFQEWRP